MAAIDARMHECYCAVFRYENHEFKEVTAPALCKPSELLAIADDNGAEFLCGNAFRIYADEIGDPAPKKLLSTDDVNASNDRTASPENILKKIKRGRRRSVPTLRSRSCRIDD